MKRLRELSREELYELVWAKPAIELAKEFGISDVAIAKTCKRLNVPKPTAGYWRKLETGQKPKRPALPRAGQKPLIVHGKQVRRKAKPQPFAGVPEDQRIYVSEELDNPHPMIRAAKRALEKSGMDTYGWLQDSWPNRSPLNLRVSSASLDRALRLLDALLKAAYKKGYTLQADATSMLVVDGERVRIRFKEKTTKKKRELTRVEQALPYWQQPSSYIYTPAGQFVIMLDIPLKYDLSPFQSWQDGQDRPLEHRLHEILEALVPARRAVIADREAWAERELRREEERKQQWEIERRRQEEQQRRDALEQQAISWRRSHAIRDFLNAVQERWRRDGGVDARGTSWLAWAAQCADLLDPLENGQLAELLAAHRNRPR
jgi:hypothetical protein